MNIAKFSEGLVAPAVSRCGAGVGSDILVTHFGAPEGEKIITIPTDYDQATIIDNYVKGVRSEKKVCHLSPDFVSENFNKVTDELKVGSTYKVVLIPILQPVGGQECVNYMLDNNYLFVGAQGLVLAQELGRGKFLANNNWIASFDEEYALYLGSAGFHKVPVSYNNSGRGTMNSVVTGGLRLGMRPFSGPWRLGDCLLCYSEE